MNRSERRNYEIYFLRERNLIIYIQFRCTLTQLHHSVFLTVIAFIKCLSRCPNKRLVLYVAEDLFIPVLSRLHLPLLYLKYSDDNIYSRLIMNI
jgi:hypothetical protein